MTEVSENASPGAQTTIALPRPVGTAARFSLQHLASGQACVTVSSGTGLQCTFHGQDGTPKVACLTLLYPVNLSLHPAVRCITLLAVLDLL